MPASGRVLILCPALFSTLIGQTKPIGLGVSSDQKRRRFRKSGSLSDDGSNGIVSATGLLRLLGCEQQLDAEPPELESECCGDGVLLRPAS